MFSCSRSLSCSPSQPLIWTEDQGWFDQWGVAQRVRYSSDQAYGIMRAFANGLSYHNFYMVTGGSNFGLQVSVLLCTVTFHANLAHSLTRSP